ncbi:MAG: hypothetical protein KTR25_19885 [Myxococcales bacterium]|nr:hypothetical protein [Myxococcales bacterium]
MGSKGDSLIVEVVRGKSEGLSDVDPSLEGGWGPVGERAGVRFGREEAKGGSTRSEVATVAGDELIGGDLDSLVVFDADEGIGGG